jgi:NitT/TauT family transport system ATP-binding protein
MAVPPSVDFRDVSKRYGGGPPVLDRISLAVEPGEFVALVGPSGCGKSTLLRLLAGLSPASEGTIGIRGNEAGTASGEIGFVFQDPTLLPWLTVAGNVEMPLRLRGIDATQRVATRARVLDLVRLAEKSASYPRQLSGGQQMRVSLARALALAPKIMLLDEPFGALDAMTREHLNEEVLAIRAHQDWTAFFVTHSVAEAVFLASRIILLTAGPGRIHADIPVPLSYPRTAETRHRRDYQELVVDVSRRLCAIDPVAA